MWSSKETNTLNAWNEGKKIRGLREYLNLKKEDSSEKELRKKNRKWNLKKRMRILKKTCERTEIGDQIAIAGRSSPLSCWSSWRWYHEMIQSSSVLERERVRQETDY